MWNGRAMTGFERIDGTLARRSQRRWIASMSSPLNKLKGQVLLEVKLEPENTGLRFSGATMGVFGAITGASMDALVGRSVTAVRYVEATCSSWNSWATASCASISPALVPRRSRLAPQVALWWSADAI